MRERSNKKYSSRSDYQEKYKKSPPPSETLAETYYYKKQMDARTDMVIVLQDGEKITGKIEWYDIDALKIDREDQSKILLLKHNIKYMYKAEADDPE